MRLPCGPGPVTCDDSAISRLTQAAEPVSRWPCRGASNPSSPLARTGTCSVIGPADGERNRRASLGRARDCRGRTCRRRRPPRQAAQRALSVWRPSQGEDIAPRALSLPTGGGHRALVAPGDQHPHGLQARYGLPQLEDPPRRPRPRPARSPRLTARLGAAVTDVKYDRRSWTVGTASVAAAGSWPRRPRRGQAQADRLLPQHELPRADARPLSR